MALDAKVITYWHDHGIDLLILTSSVVAENLWIQLKNETKPWLREAAIVTISNRNEHRCRALDNTGPIEIAAHAAVVMPCCRPSTPTAIRPTGVSEAVHGIDNE